MAMRSLSARAARPRWRRAPFRVVRAGAETHDTWTLELEPVDGRAARRRRRASSRCSTPSASARCRSRSAATPRRPARPHRARGRRRHRGDLRRRARRACSASAARSATPGRSTRRAGGDVVVVAGGHRPGAAAARALPRAARAAADFGEVVLLYGSRTPADLLYRSELERWRALDARRSTSPSTAPRAAGTARSASCPKLIAGAAVRPGGGASRFVCGPEIMMRFAAEALLERGVAAERIHVSMERNMQCGVGHCGHCQLGPTLICRDGPVYTLGRARAAAGGAGAVSGSGKPKLAVWKFASCDGCQLSLLDCEDELLALAGEVEIAYFLEARRATVRGPVRPLARRGLDHDRARRRADPRGAPRSHGISSRSAPAPRPAASRRCKNFADVNEFVSAVYASPRVHLDARDLDADLRPRAGRLRAARLPDQQAPAARGDRGVPPRAAAEHALDERLHRVQAPRDGLRDGRARDAVPRPGDPRRLRRPLPLLRPRLLRLLRADGDAEHGLADPAAQGARPRATPESSGSSAPSTSRRSRAGAPPMAERRTTTIRTDYLARVEGEGAMHVTVDGRRGDRRQAQDLRAAALLRGVPARPRVHRGARHHRPHLRHLPGRLPDELGARDGADLRHRGRRAAARPAPAPLLRRMDREPRPARLHAPRARTSSATRARSSSRGTTRSSSRRALELKKAGNEVMTVVGGREVHPINVRVGGFYRVPRKRELAPLVEKLERAREIALEAVRVDGRPRLPRLRAGLRARRARRAGRVPDRPGADRLEPRPRHRRLRVRRALRRGARRMVERAPLRRARARLLPLRAARALRARLRPPLAARARSRARGGSSGRTSATRSGASSCARSSSSTRPTRRCG